MMTRERKGFPVLVTAAVLTAAIACNLWLPRRPERCVVITADDAGMYTCVNAATIRELDDGSVSSCSILVPCPAFEGFAAYAAAHREKDFGVHLALNCDTDTHRWGPVLPRSKVPSLVDSDGYLWRYRPQVAQHARVDEAEIELRAQINKALNRGIRVSHLDHHVYVMYARPDFLRLYVRLALEYGIPIRYSRHVPKGLDFDASNAALVQAFNEGLQKLQSHGFPIFDEIDTKGYDAAPAEKREYYLKLLHGLKPGVTEIPIHCADLVTGDEIPPNADRRVADARVFASEEMTKTLRRLDIRVLRWAEFRNRKDRSRHMQ